MSDESAQPGQRQPELTTQAGKALVEYIEQWAGDHSLIWTDDVPDRIAAIEAEAAAAARAEEQAIVDRWLQSEDAERRLAEALHKLFPAAQYNRWPFTLNEAARAILAALRSQAASQPTGVTVVTVRKRGVLHGRSIIPASQPAEPVE